MRLGNVRLILNREVRDQLRDRRTLFMIFVLPVLLYPLLGMSFVQISQFRQEKPTRVAIVGVEQLEGLPPLIEKKHFAANLFADEAQTGLLELVFPQQNAQGESPVGGAREEAFRMVQTGQCDAAICFPSDFAKRVRDSSPQATNARMELFFNTATEKSMLARDRLDRALRTWSEQIVARRLQEHGLSPTVAKPFRPELSDVAAVAGRVGAAGWAKLLPVLLMLWALTGAFYPAVDLCAGEKERGTLETLLSSPAHRSEIVLGKLLTIMLFSMATATLNLLSIALTGVLLLRGSGIAMGMPPASAVWWLAAAMVPLSALFSALSLALAAFARSTKEGQYYLMPLLLVTMPLTVVSTSPGVELNLGNCLIPVTGMVLLLRAMLEGHVWEAMPFAAPVLAVTMVCCLLAIRWAVEQFNSETVLFRESERLSLGLWVRHLMRDREPTPSVAAAVFGGVLILVVRFFIGLSAGQPRSPSEFAFSAVVTQVVVILTPALLMTVVFASDRRTTLLLRWPRRRSGLQEALVVPAAILLAVALYPTVDCFRSFVLWLYPFTPEMKRALEQLSLKNAPLGELLLVMAVLPAVCEELAFRGFVLSGFRHLGHRWRAVVYSALFFAVTHAILQQSVIVFVVGLVLGLLAVQTGSLFPCIAFHATHNSLAVLSSLLPDALERYPWLESVLHKTREGGIAFDWQLTVAGACVAAAVIAWFMRLPSAQSREETLQDAIHRGLPSPTV